VQTIRSSEELARARAELGSASLALVPTMGALHAGHMALVAEAKARADKVAATIFVNPMQFGANEDLSRYPRREADDAKMLAEAGCDLLWMPSVSDVYPDDFATTVRVSGVSERWEGEARPGHFDGVATVVAKLLLSVRPDVALFGEKDFQQLAIIRYMVADLCLPIEIVGAPTVRESDGLAMSSRNQYLTAQERKIAPTLHAALTRAVKRISAGEKDLVAVEKAELDVIARAGFRPDYFTVRDAKTLLAPAAEARHLVVLVAARLGKARLIDNLQVIR